MTTSYLNTLIGDISYTKDTAATAQKKNKEKKLKYYERNKEKILTKRRALHLAKKTKRESLRQFFEQIPETVLFPHKGNLQIYLIERLLNGYHINDNIYDTIIDYFVSKIMGIKHLAHIKKILEPEIGQYDNITSSLYLDISAEYYRRKKIRPTVEDLFSII